MTSAPTAHPRYAIYYAPEPDEPLAAFGRTWLGYDAESGQPMAQPAIDGRVPEWLAEITAEPRRYGFHGTLKPPFVLASDASESGLLAAVTAFAAATPPVDIGLVQLAAIAGFLALVPVDPPAALADLAASCVREFDRFRAAPSAADLAKRRRASLTPRQDALLREWGYPYVFEEFRFHLTLTRRLDPGDVEVVRPLIEGMTAGICATPVRVGALAIFWQASPEAPFRVMARVPLAGAHAPRRPQAASA
jgi:putative phosphonate metabolism protein